MFATPIMRYVRYYLIMDNKSFDGLPIKIAVEL